jgi:molecular chaperone GrpE
MDSQNPAGAGAGADQPRPGFTFADKRKVSADVPPTATSSAAGAAPTDDAASEPVDGAAAVDSSGTPGVSGADQAATAAETAGGDAGQPSADATLAAERLVDLQRLQAEYANYRKRVDRDRDVARTAAIASVVESLLPVLDDIHLARQHGDLESGPFVSIAEKLETTLARYGVERFGEPGTPFDPAIHDALMHVEEELAEGTDVTTVVGVLQPGYRIGEKVVRPARVSVADPS